MSRQEDIARLIRRATEAGEFVELDCGGVVYWPNSTGAYSEWVLKALAEELHRRNAERKEP